MAEPNVISLRVCPGCGAQTPQDAEVCQHCGEPLEESSIAQRATVPAERPAPPEPTLVVPGGEDDDPPDSHRPRSSRVTDQPIDDDDDDRDSWHPSGPDPLIGYVVAGRYRILECIGRGGMGVVYKVEHTEIGKLLALKLLAGELCRDREIVRRFKREALLASKLSHPNSVQVFDFGISEGLTYIVMELVNGQDLGRIVKVSGPMPFDRVCRIILQVCSSLAEAHGMGIVHRDLKPENILISRTKEGNDLAKVLDFGLAKLREAPELNEVTGHGTVVGTPYYMAPEQIMGRPIDGRADIYALGAVMYKALTGETLFLGNSPMAVFTQHLNETPVPMRERNPAVSFPDAVDDIVRRALAKHPEDRFQTIEELQSAIVEVLGGLGQSAVEMLLDSSRLRMLHAEALSGAPLGANDASRMGMSRTLVRKAEIATRDEVEAFHRKLARQKRFALVIGIITACVAALGGMHAWQEATAPPGFNGFEIEPNSQANEANEVPFGAEVQGQLGKRLAHDQSDRDFFRIAVPLGVSAISVTSRPLPNMPLCVWAYRSGEPNAVGRWCSGRPGLALDVPAWRMEPGTYLFAVMQDREPYGAESLPFVMENISDFYALKVSPVIPEAGEELEPNDARQVACAISPGGEVRGSFGWTQDEDMACVASDARGKMRWVVEDAIERPRDRGAVLQVTPANGPRPGVGLRVHRAGQTGKVTADDVVGPWRSEPFDPASGADPACLSLRLTLDPWAGDNAPLTPPVSGEHWIIRVERVP